MSKEFDEFIDQWTKTPPAEVGIMVELMGGTAEHADAMHQFQSDSQAARATTDRDNAFDLLEETPGTDMALEVVHEGVEALPAAGWIISANIAPGYAGKVETYKFLDDGMEIKYLPDHDELIRTLDEYGEVSVSVDFKHDRFTDHVIGYENPAYPFKDKDPCERSGPNYLGLRFGSLDIVDLNNGGRLLTERPRDLYGGSLFTGFRYRDLARESVRKYSPSIDINRITDNPEELGAIVGHLALGMGLSAEDSAAFVEASVPRII